MWETMAMTRRNVQFRAAGIALAVAAGAPALSSAGGAKAEVIERSADHFVLRNTTVLETTLEDVWTSLGDVDQWWDGAHTYSGDAANMSLRTEVGGCFCEANVQGATFEHGRVVEADPALGVLLHAALGPLKGKTTRADWSFGWSSHGPGIELVMTYVVRGEGVGAWADGVDSVMSGQFQRLTRYIEYGEP
jgi:hypothetical protein